MDLSKIIMIDKNINIFQIEPLVMAMAVEAELDELAELMIEKMIPIHPEDYRGVHQLAINGKLAI